MSGATWPLAGSLGILAAAATVYFEIDKKLRWALQRRRVR